MSLIEKLKKAGSVKSSQILSESTFFNVKDSTPTEIPIINIALSADVNGGLSSGLNFIAGPSRNFKSLLGLMLVKAYMQKYSNDPNCVCLFYDSEFGITPKYIKTNGIDTEKIIHIPVEHLEQLKFDISKRLEQIERGDKVIIFIDSVGNLASKKEVEDALEEKSVADMSRAKVMKSLWRIVTPHLTIKDIPCVVINHTYSEMALYPKQIMSGGCVVKGTKIKTPEGLKEIQNIKEGDLITTKYGLNSVKYTWNPETLENGTPECYEIEFEDGYTITCSEEHKFLVNGEWIMTKNLLVNMDCEILE